MKVVFASRSRSRRFGRWVPPLAGGLSLLAAGLLVAALSPAFVSQACPFGPPGCSGLSGSLGESPDAWAVAWIAGILAATAVLFLAGISGRLVAALNAIVSLAAMGLAIFEGLVAFPRILGSVEVVPGGVHFALGPGYYLFLIGGVLAVGASTAMATVLARDDGEREIAVSTPLRGWGVIAIGRASLCVLAGACVGAFLPFVTLSCGFGCPPGGPPLAVASGSLIAGFDGPIVITLLVGAALATVIRMAGQGKAVASSVALLLALAATVLVSFDSLNGAIRVLGWAYGIPTVPDPGYYVLQIGTALSAILSMLLVTADHPTWALFRRAGAGRREPAPSV